MFAAARTGPSQRWAANPLVTFIISTLYVLAGCNGDGSGLGRPPA